MVELDCASVVKLDLKLVKLDHPGFVKQSITVQVKYSSTKRKGLNWINIWGPSKLSKQVVKQLVKLDQSLFI